jgi:hypothetical protein
LLKSNIIKRLPAAFRIFLLTGAGHGNVGFISIVHALAVGSANGISSIILCTGMKRTDAHAFYEHNGYYKDSYCLTGTLVQELLRGSSFLFVEVTVSLRPQLCMYVHLFVTDNSKELNL